MRRRETGSLLLEVMIAISVLAVGILGFLSAFMANARASDEVREKDQARVQLENVIERLRHEDFDTLYANYNYMWVEVPGLEWYGGTTAMCYVSFYTDETYVPYIFGPITDIDGDPSTVNYDCSTSYEVLPARLILYWWSREGYYKYLHTYLLIGPEG